MLSLLLRRCRMWLAARLVDLSLRIDPPPVLDFDRIFGRIEKTLDRDMLVDSPDAPNPRPPTKRSLIEPTLGGTKESAAAYLRWMAGMVEQGHVRGFQVGWLERNESGDRVMYAPHVGRA